jgi:N-acetylmuramoyl-L-alanine amidase
MRRSSTIAAGIGIDEVCRGVASSCFIPAIITEFAFLTNKEDLHQVDTFLEQVNEAGAIARGIVEYTK